MARKASGNPGMGTSGTVSGVLRESWGFLEPRILRGPGALKRREGLRWYRGLGEILKGLGARES